jgi:hypothetical protein
LQVSFGAFVFQLDIFLDIPIIANLEMIQKIPQVLINENLGQQNWKRHSFDYQVQQEILVRIPNSTKL